MTRTAARLAGLLSLLLAGCATPPADESPSLSGRLALQVAAHAAEPARHLGATFELRGSAEQGALALSTPIGSTLAQARWRPGDAELTTADGSQRFADLDALTRQMLGEPLPLVALFDWLRARPWPGAGNTPTDAGFEQLGWRVDLSRYADGWVTMQRPQPPAVTLRVRLDDAR